MSRQLQRQLKHLHETSMSSASEEATSQPSEEAGNQSSEEAAYQPLEEATVKPSNFKNTDVKDLFPDFHPGRPLRF